MYGLDLALHAGATGARRNHGHQPRRGLFREPGCWADAHHSPGGATFALAYQKVDGIYVPPSRDLVKTVGTDVNFDGAGGVRCPAERLVSRPGRGVTIEATTTNIRVDLVARLNAADGTSLGRCSGVGECSGTADADPVRTRGLLIRSGASISDSRRRCSSASKQSGTAQYTRVELDCPLRGQGGVRVTGTADWAPTFERVGQIPGTNSLQPPKNLAEQQAWINRPQRGEYRCAG